MSEIKLVYQSQTDGVWHDVTDKEYAFRRELSGVYKTRIIYPAADYEAQRNEVERLKAENEAQAKRIAELEQKEKVLDRLINEFEGKHKFVGTRRVYKKLPLDLGRMENAATICAEHVDVFQWVFLSHGEPSFKQAVMNLLPAKNGDSK